MVKKQKAKEVWTPVGSNQRRHCNKGITTKTPPCHTSWLDYGEIRVCFRPHERLLLAFSGLFYCCFYNISLL